MDYTKNANKLKISLMDVKFAIPTLSKTGPVEIKIFN